jgi:hypothetical protein
MRSFRIERLMGRKSLRRRKLASGGLGNAIGLQGGLKFCGKIPIAVHDDRECSRNENRRDSANPGLLLGIFHLARFQALMAWHLFLTAPASTLI